MRISGIFYVYIAVCISLGFYLISRNIEIIGPDFNSYSRAFAGGINSFMLREIVSWGIISLFHESFDELLVLACILQLFLCFSLISLSVEHLALSGDFNSRMFLLGSLSLIVMFNPFTYLLSISAFRQGIGAVFFIIAISCLFNKKMLKFSFFCILSILSHNSFLIFVSSIIFFYYFNFISIYIKFVFYIILLFIAVKLFIPRADLVTDSNRFLYGGSHVLAVAYASFLGSKKLRIIVFSAVAPAVGFISDPSYFDRMSLFSTALIWPVAVAYLYGHIKPRLSIGLIALPFSLVFGFVFSRLATGW